MWIAGIPDWLVIYLIFNYVGLGVLGVYFLYTKRFKIGYRIDFFRLNSEVGRGLGKPLKGFDRSGSVVKDFGGLKVKTFSVSMSPDSDVKVDVDEKGRGVVSTKGVGGDVVCDDGRNGDWVSVGDKEFKLKDKSVLFGAKVFTMEFLRHSCYRKFGFTVYSIDYDTGDVLTFNPSARVSNPDHSFTQLNNAVRDRWLAGGGFPPMFLYIILGIVVAGVVAGLLGGYVAGGWGKVSESAYNDLLAKLNGTGVLNGVFP